MSIIITIIELIIILSVVAIVHEFGHFLVAKAFKMTVNEFSIGFGKVLWQKKIKGTVYSFRLILLGGYVSIEGEGEETQSENSFSNKPCYQRILVLVAGVAFNFVLAILIMLGVNFATDTYTTTLKSLSEDSVLYEAGLKSGDTITKIGNITTHVYQDIALYADYKNSDVVVEYITSGEEKSVVVKDVVKTRGFIGIYFKTDKVYADGTVKPIIDIVQPGGRAEKAGLKAGDEIIKVGDVSVTNSASVIAEISKFAEQQVEVVVIRNKEEKSIEITPEKTLYVDFGITDVEAVPTTLGLSWYKSVNTIIRTVNSYADLFKGKVKLSQMSGIVGVGEMVSKTDGLVELLSLLATLSLAIGIANIMPFPPLDGGKVVLVIIEWISRKKVSQKVEIVLSAIGFLLLILLTIYVTIKDIIRII